MLIFLYLLLLQLIIIYLELKMIETVLDANENNLFCGVEYPIIEIITENPQNWEDYKALASKIITDNSDKSVIMFKIKNKNFSLNKLSLALFTESIKLNSSLNYAVFKVDDFEKARNNYKPYVALTIGVKYAITLSKETPQTIYKNISELGYLGISSKRSYTNNTMELTLANGNKPLLNLNAQNINETIAGVAVLKALSLAQIKIYAKLDIDINESDTSIDVDWIIAKIIKDISEWID